MSRATGHMHAAPADSERLQRVALFLADGMPHSTLDIITGARVCAVNSCISELRVAGFAIECERRGDVWYYTMIHKPEPTTEN